MTSGALDAHLGAGFRSSDNLARNLYCVLGLPIDALEMPSVLQRIDAAAASKVAFLISTPNLDFLVQSRSDPQFRETLLSSDLCPADGMPIIWIARLIGLPVKTKVSGSDIFDALKAPGRLAHQLNVFLFGGAEGVAEAAATTLNAAPAGLQSVGTLNPGFSTVADMSCDHILDNINVSNADFLVVALGAKKGQAWLHSNHYRLTVPIRVHLGAVINFQAGTVSRAPRWLRTWGLEWLWRIKEEPQLWRRYFYGGVILLSLLFTRILPLAVATRWYRLKSRHRPEGLTIEIAYNQASAAIRVRGAATEPNVELAIRSFQEVLNAGIKIATLDLSGLVAIDGRFFGLFFMLRKCLKKQGGELRFVGVPSSIQRMFRLHEVNFLLEDA